MISPQSLKYKLNQPFSHELQIWSTGAHRAAITAVNFDSQGNQLMTAGEDGCVGIWPCSSFDY
ncbi:hypothetical protein TSMEX_007444 [Taenia solium]|eukprot:TsM_001063500 transcript=TsM_001063500 gene=TsM_001063500